MAQQTLDGDLKALLTAIEGLPPSFQSGRRSDPLGTYLTPGLSDDGDPKPVFPVDEDGLYGTFNTAWERVFQKCPSDADDKLKKLVHHGRGKHGLILAHAWAEHYATVVTSDERALIQLRAQTLLALIRANIGPTVNGGKISHLKSGLAVGINFADFIKIRGTYEYDMPFGVSYLYPASTTADTESPDFPSNGLELDPAWPGSSWMSTLEHSRVFWWLVDIHRAEAHRLLRLDPVPAAICAMALLTGESRVGAQVTIAGGTYIVSVTFHEY
ncbi:hypothetical protein GGX14DRAFT_394910 [Mycena pura]|uniref:Uncharacterized protein n=1 Tax=Mycena pura TaxID=153505 RepID=A0AAD6VE95_9AGAR|nr:hypothetical protein GGX14DRAFT_394910 [Mycena pura]